MKRLVGHFDEKVLAGYQEKQVNVLGQVDMVENIQGANFLVAIQGDLPGNQLLVR